MNKNSAFYGCLAALVANVVTDSETDSADLIAWFDRIFDSPVSPGVIDSTPEGPARMACEVYDYWAGTIDMPAWMKNFAE